MKVLQAIAIMILAVGFVVACAPEGVKKDGEPMTGVPDHHEKASIYPGQFYETCVELYPNQVLEYSFQASQPVDFNIHYHGMEGRMYAIKKDKIKSYTGELVCNEMDFYDKDQEYFCMIWSNPPDTEIEARLSLKYSIKDQE